MKFLPLANVRADLSKLVDEAVLTHERIEITRNGHRAAVLLSAEDYDGMVETLEVMSDPDLRRSIQEGREDFANGNTMTLEEALSFLRQQGHDV